VEKNVDSACIGFVFLTQFVGKEGESNETPTPRANLCRVGDSSTSGLAAAGAALSALGKKSRFSSTLPAASSFLTCL
jgi:hypothetical protein